MKFLDQNLEKHLFHALDEMERSVVIISPHIDFEMASRLLTYKNKNADVTMTIITTFNEKNFIDEMSSLNALKILLALHAEVFSMEGLQSNMYVIDDKYCFSGSAGFSKKDLNRQDAHLLCFEQPSDVQTFSLYVQKLLQQASECRVTFECIKEKELAIQREGENALIRKGQKLEPTVLKENPTVLSVSAGQTVELVNENLVHAHPSTKSYNYAKTDYIAFRRPNGGIMDCIYYIVRTIDISMERWEDALNELSIEDKHKRNIAAYIQNRNDGLKFEQASIYKFYILERYEELPNCPRPRKNNSGGWLYEMDELRSGNPYVETISQKKHD